MFQDDSDNEQEEEEHEEEEMETEKDVEVIERDKKEEPIEERRYILIDSDDERYTIINVPVLHYFVINYTSHGIKWFYIMHCIMELFQVYKCALVELDN